MVNKVVYNNNAYYRKLGYCRQTALRPVYTWYCLYYEWSEV